MADNLNKRKVLLGITGSIAAYKSAFLIRLLIKEKAEVKVIMTRGATDFVAPLTFSTLSTNPVYTEFYESSSGEWNNHVELGLWADLLLIAPATANTIAKMANGICDNLLLATYLSARCPVFVAPAMDLDMYRHPATKANLEKLLSFGNYIIPAEEGELASGLYGEGRMAEPDHIISSIKQQPEKKNDTKAALSLKKALITAGPTYEPIDPVRFIGNHSSGKMGFALAQALAELGTEVTLIAGPTHLKADHPNIRKIDVRTAKEMYEETLKYFPAADITVMAAAVADFTPENPSATKIKKQQDTLTIPLVKTADILQKLGELKKANQILAGFALETDNELENARYKLQNKNLDFIVLNSLKDEKAGFGYDTNKISIIDRSGNIESFGLKSKLNVAGDIVKKILNLVKNVEHSV